MRSQSPKEPAESQSLEQDPNRFLNTRHLSQDLRGRSVRGGVATIAAQGGRFIIALGATSVLARILTPSDFGLLAMVATLTNFFGRFKDLGLAMATVQQEDITHQQVSALFWVNMGLGLVVTGMTVTAAPLVAWFFGEPSLTLIVLALGTSFLFGGLTVQHQAILRRQMRFTAIGTVQVVSAIVGALAGVASAWQGAGYWALVVMQLVTHLSGMVGVWLFCGWRPGRLAWDASIRPMLAFGGNLTGANLLNFFVRNLDNILLGKYWGTDALGLYAKAYQLLMLPIRQFNAPLTSVAIPALSRLQDKPEQFVAYYKRGIEMLAMVGMPIVVFSAVAADEVILIVLGEGWREAAPIFRLLSPAAFFGTFNVASGWIYVSLGRTDRQLRWSIIGFVASTIAIIIGLRWGPIGMAAAISMVAASTRIPGLMYCYYESPVGLRDLWQALRAPAITSLAAGGGLYAAESLIWSQASLVPSALFACLTYGALYMAGWMLIPNGRQTLRQLREMAKDLKGGSA